MAKFKITVESLAPIFNHYEIEAESMRDAIVDALKMAEESYWPDSEIGSPIRNAVDLIVVGNEAYSVFLAAKDGNQKVSDSKHRIGLEVLTGKELIDGIRKHMPVYFSELEKQDIGSGLAEPKGKNPTSGGPI